jgi:hypothetical protein
MTATATVVTKRAESVLSIRNSALRFEPLPPEQKPGQAQDEKKPKGGEQTRLRPGPGQGRVYREGPGPKESPGTTAQLVDIGISDGVWTELRGGLDKGARVIVDERPRTDKKGFRLF